MGRDLNIYELAGIAATFDHKAEDDFHSASLWVEIDNPDGSWDLYTVQGFKDNLCTPTLKLTHVEHCTP